MEIIKKRLNAYKVDLETAQERAELAERHLREHLVRADRAESEVIALARRLTLLEGDLEKAETRVRDTCNKLDEAQLIADEGERTRKQLEHRAATDEERIEILEVSLRETRLMAEDSDRKYDEVVRKLILLDGQLERAEDRARKAELKQDELEGELVIVGNNLRALELAEEQQLKRQEQAELAARQAHQRAHETECRAELHERQVIKMQLELARLEEILVMERAKYKHMSDELDQTLSEYSTVAY